MPRCGGGSCCFAGDGSVEPAIGRVQNRLIISGVRKETNCRVARVSVSLACRERNMGWKLFCSNPIFIVMFLCRFCHPSPTPDIKALELVLSRNSSPHPQEKVESRKKALAAEETKNTMAVQLLAEGDARSRK